jgi:hypothetical protein
MAETSVELWVIYGNPRDFPDLFVLRRHVVINGEVYIDRDCQTALTLKEIRKFLPSGLYNVGRLSCDDPVIKEVWV